MKMEVSKNLTRVFLSLSLAIASILLICMNYLSVNVETTSSRKPFRATKFTNNIPRPSSKVVSDTREFFIRKNDSLINITKPWFRVFPEEKNLERNLSFFVRGDTIVTTLPGESSLNPKDVCDGGRIDLLILVPSVVGDSGIRRTIRKTWASPLYDSNWRQKTTVKLVFCFGELALDDKDQQELRNESSTYGDILTTNMTDSYGNLSLKIASMLFWSVNFCRSAKYVAKIDVDTLFDIPLLLTLLEHRPNIPASTIGFQHAYERPSAVRSGRWAIPVSLYPFDVLPHYVYGHSYVLTREAVDRVVSSLHYFPIIPNEDAFITGIMSMVSNVTRIHSPAFAHLFLKQTYQDLRNSRFVSAIHKKTNLFEAWENILRHNSSAVGGIL